MVWFHVSDTWKFQEQIIQPIIGRRDDYAEPELKMLDERPAICVAPSFGQCIYALGEWQDYSVFRVYYTKDENPEPCPYVFDFSVTHEHRFMKPTKFQKMIEFDVEELCDATGHFRSIKFNDKPANQLKIAMFIQQMNQYFMDKVNDNS